jgi:hypothetical protein
MWFVLATQQMVRVWRNLYGLAIFTLILALFVAFLALTSVQWDGKSEPFFSIIAQIPRLNPKEFLTDAQLSFNPNEIAGAMAWLCPLAFGLVAWHKHFLWRLGFGSAGLLLLFALFLGQSRFAIFGVLGGLLFLLVCYRTPSSPALLPKEKGERNPSPRWRGVGVRFATLLSRAKDNHENGGISGGMNAAPTKSRLNMGIMVRFSLIIIVLALVLFQIQLVRTVPETPNPTATDVMSNLSGRDQSSINTRLQMWQRSLEMLSNHPLTGIGMSMYRSAIRTPQYQIPYFEEINFTAPHTHNEWLQIAVDLGVPGIVWFVALHVYGAWLFWRTPHRWQAWIVGIVAAWLAHSIYGLGDAVTLWDRFAFVFWLVVAWLVAAHEAQKLRYNAG